MFNRQEQWTKGNSLVEAIIAKGVQQYFTDLKVEQAFHLQDLVVECMDGRTPGGVHLAGSGVLLGLEKALLFAGQVEQKYGRLEAVTYHRDCGAAALVAKETGGDPFALAKTFAEDFARSLDIEAVYEVENEGWEGFHHERVVYYDGTGRFNWKGVKGLPVGFVISRAYLDFDIEYAKKELETALDIALKPHNGGGHGFGEMFTSELPLLVIVLAESRSRLGELKAEAESVVEELPGASRSRVRVDGYLKKKG